MNDRPCATCWYFSVRYEAKDGLGAFCHRAIVGPASASTVEAALHLAGVPEDVRAEIRANPTVRDFVDGKLDPELSGYYVPNPMRGTWSWLVCIGPVHAVIS